MPYQVLIPKSAQKQIDRLPDTIGDATTTAHHCAGGRSASEWVQEDERL
jgi:mRNA-degrading endonuclease RelE of RelBE toxin-antitoxin system